MGRSTIGMMMAKSTALAFVAAACAFGGADALGAGSAAMPLKTSSFTAAAAARPVQATTGRKTGAMDLNMGKVSAVGPFTPIVIATRSIVGEKSFNQLRGKGITLHSQVIGEFCAYAGVPTPKKQGLIRLAKANGNTLGFLS